MTRTEKYMLDRILIELDAIAEELVEYCKLRGVFDNIFGDPIGQIERFFNDKG